MSSEEAQYHMEKVLEYNPKFNLEARRKVSLFKNIEDTNREIEALRNAGAPEHPQSYWYVVKRALTWAFLYF